MKYLERRYRQGSSWSIQPINNLDKRADFGEISSEPLGGKCRGGKGSKVGVRS